MYNEKNYILHKYKRKAEPLESFVISFGDVKVGICIRVNGYVHKDKFIKSVNKIVNTFPIIKSKIVLDKKNKPWFIEMEDENLVSIIDMKSDDTFVQVVDDERKKPFFLHEGPLAKFILIHSNSYSDILFLAHHAIIDGFGANKVMNLLLKYIAYDEFDYGKIQDKEYLPSIKNLKHFRPKLSPLLITKRIIDFYVSTFIICRWHLTKLHISEEDFVYSQRTFLSNYHQIWTHDILTENETYDIYKICREKNVTVNSTMMVAFLACRKEIDDENENNRQRICVDLRRHLNKEAQNSLGTFASAIDTKYKYDSSIPFWNNVQKYNHIFKQKMNNYEDVDCVFKSSKISLDFTKAMSLSYKVNNLPKDYKNLEKFKKLGPKSFHIVASVARNMIKSTASVTITDMGVGKYSNTYGDLKLQRCILFPSPTIKPMSIIIASITVNKCLGYTFNVTKHKDIKDENFHIKLNLLRKRFKEFLIKDIYLN